jgi:hypothetical protein
VLLSAGTLTLLQYINIVNLNYVRPYTSSFRHVIILRRLEWPTPNHQRQSLEAGNESNKGSSWPLFIVGLITRWDSRGRDRAELSQSPAFIMWWPEHLLYTIYIVLHLRLLLLASYNILLYHWPVSTSRNAAHRWVERIVNSCGWVVVKEPFQAAKHWQRQH